MKNEEIVIPNMKNTYPEQRSSNDGHIKESFNSIAIENREETKKKPNLEKTLETQNENIKAQNQVKKQVNKDSITRKKKLEQWKEKFSDSAKKKTLLTKLKNLSRN